jgi:ribosomal protein L40E
MTPAGAKAPAPLMEMDMKEEQDDLTLVYMFGYKNGKDSMKAEIERLLLIEQGAANLCDKCGWRMKFPNEECRNCENAKLRDEIERLRAVLRRISQAPHGKVYCADGHEEAVLIARAALEGEKNDG